MPSQEAAQRELLVKAQGGDRDAFGKLVRLDYPRAMAVALSLVGNRSDAEDIVVETYTKAWKALKGFRGASAFATWRFRIELNCHKDWLRSKVARERHVASLDEKRDDKDVLRIPDPAPGPEAAVEAAGRLSQQEDMVHRTLGRLNPGYRFLLVLVHLYEMPYEEILECLDAILRDGGFEKSLPAAEGLTVEQFTRLHEEVCPRHGYAPDDRKRKRNAFDMKLFHARDAFRKAVVQGGGEA